MSDLQQTIRTLGVGKEGQFNVPFALAARYLLNDNNDLIRIFASNNNVIDIEGSGAPTDGVRATLTTALTGTNNDLIFTAVKRGATGVNVAYVNPGNNGVLAVAVNGNAVTVTLATNGSGVITSTAAQVAAAVNAANAPVTAANAGGNDGTGLVTVMSATALSGGVAGTGAGIAGKGSRYCNYAAGTWYRNTGTLDEPAWVTP